MILHQQPGKRLYLTPDPLSNPCRKTGEKRFDLLCNSDAKIESGREPRAGRLGPRRALRPAKSHMMSTSLFRTHRAAGGPMNSPDCLFASWRNWPQALEHVLHETSNLAERADAIARLLRPSPSCLAACQLVHPDGTALGIAADADVPRPRVTELIHAQLSRLSSSTSETLSFTIDGSFPWAGLAAPIRHGPRTWGFVLLAASDPSAIKSPAEALLPMAAHALALHLDLEAVLQERQQSIELILLGDAVAGLVHEVNNSLNTMLLQASIVEMKADAALRTDVAPIKREGAQIAARLLPLQRLRQQLRQQQALVDLPGVVREVVAEHGGEISAELRVPLPGRSMNRSALKRLLEVMLRLSRESLNPGQKLRVRTVQQASHVGIVFEPASGDAALVVPTGQTLPFDALPGLEGLAALSLARLVQGTLSVMQLADGSHALMIAWKEPAHR